VTSKSETVEVTRLSAGSAAQASAVILRALHARRNAPASGMVSPESLIEDSRLGLVLIAVASGRIVGAGTLIGQWIYNVAVEPDCWRRGIGTRIMDALETHARQADMRSIGLFSNLSALAFYEARGFRHHRSWVIYQQQAVEMYKDLAEATPQAARAFSPGPASPRSGGSRRSSELSAPQRQRRSGA
jgi:GNAT superfamily N-acetyltransferase